jgi:hypothetical protein
MGSPSPLAADPYGRVSFVASRIVFSSGVGHKGVPPLQISAVKARMGQIYRSVEDLGVQEGSPVTDRMSTTDCRSRSAQSVY